MSPRHKPVIIGLAGGIGAGKSSVAKILAEMGCVVSDSDVAARDALRDPQIKAAITSWWGSDVLNAQGEIDRAAVAGIVFNDPGQRKRLEDLMHPWIEQKRLDLFARAPASAAALVIDAPLLFEAGLDAKCDAIIYVEAGEDLRRQRIVANRGWTRHELALREQSQMALDLKRDRADYVVENNGDLDRLREQIRLVLDTIIRSYRSSS